MNTSTNLAAGSTRTSAHTGHARRRAWAPAALLALGGLVGAAAALAATSVDAASGSTDPRVPAEASAALTEPRPAEAAVETVRVPPLGISRCTFAGSIDAITSCFEDPWDHRSGAGSLAPAAATLAWAADEVAATGDPRAFDHPAVSDALAVLCDAGVPVCG